MQAEHRPNVSSVPKFRRSVAALVAACLAAGVAAVGVPGADADSQPVDPANPATPRTVTADALPTTQIDGVAWTQLIVGDTVFVGGLFSNARPAGAAPGTNLTPRSNFLAYDVRTGELITTIAPSFNAQVKAIAVSPDGTRLYVGGDFTTVNGIRRDRLAAFELPSMRLVGNFLPPVGYHVHALTVSHDNATLYVGGNFTAVGSQVRNRLAAFRTTDGALLSWAPNAQGGMVSAMVLSPDGTQLAVGGRFTSMNGSTNPGYGLAAVDTTTGATRPWAINAVVRNAQNDTGITGLTTDGVNVYGVAFNFNMTVGNYEGMFAASWDGGRVTWIGDCHGDNYSLYVQSGALYTVGHAHNCSTINGFPETSPRTWHRAVALSTAATGVVARNTQGGYNNFEGYPAPSPLLWYPDLDAGTFTGMAQGPWSVTGDARYVVLGGEFTSVNFRAQQGLVRFAVADIAPNREGPRLFQNTWGAPTATSTFAGTVRLAIATNWDRDNETLFYRVERNGVLVGQPTAAISSFWRRPTVSLVDTGATPGANATYRVIVSDAAGNTAASNPVTVAVSATGTRSAYTDAVLATGGLTNYWRLGETAGTFADLVGSRPATLSGAATRGVVGAVPNDADRAVTFNGGTAFSGGAGAAGPQTFSVEAWFRTSSTRGGKVLGFGSATVGNSASYDRHLYIGNDGRLRFGVYPGAVRTVASPTSLVDDQWHHAVATLGGGELTLYVDGVQVDRLTGVASAQAYNGFWRIGGDNLTGWPNRPLGDFFTGTVDDVAIYDTPLSAATIQRHYETGRTGAVPNVLPTASYTFATAPLQVAVNASASTDADGTVTGYSWNWGDGTTGTGAITNHTYAAAGTYTVVLTVTDNRGGTATRSQQVVVPGAPANQPPAAAFGAATSPRQVAVDASASTDVDGTIVSYAWDFGDGTTGAGVTAARSYDAAGTYTVSLTVTDDDGATSTTAQQVVVPDIPVNGAPTASFTSTVSPLQVGVDGSASTDDVGIVSYAWNFGDGSTGTGATASRTYAAAGTYTVTLTVTDAQGLTGTSSQSVVVPAVPVGPQPFATDAFQRTLATTLGTADLGGAWTLSGSATNFSVNGGQAALRMGAPAQGVSAFLPGTSTDTEVRATVGIDKPATGGAVFNSVVGRRVGTSDYRAKVRYLPTGGVQIFITRVSGTETDLVNLTVPGLTYTPGERLQVRFQATGVLPTTLRLKVWKVGTPEPAAWQLTTTDATAALQTGGGIGLVTYLSSAATNAPVVGLFDDVWAGPTA